MTDQTETTSPLDNFDHVVVLMLENRSFDNLLGFLYEDGVPAGKRFAGLQDGNHSNPVPSRAIDAASHQQVNVEKAADYHQPYPDPGETWPHVNTQLFNHVDPDNVGVDGASMTSPYNLPTDAPAVPPMNGFVNDYINTNEALLDKQVKYEQYSQIMQCFKPDQLPVMSALAQNFAVFDHWFCSVPSQTWCNRAFWHTGTSGGELINPIGEGGHSVRNMWDWHKQVWHKKNLFDALAEQDISWKIYAETVFSLTSAINGITKNSSGHVVSDPDLSHELPFGFQHDLKHNSLPQYSFIEPRFIMAHNDQHPSTWNSKIFGKTDPGTVLRGEKLIYDVYTAIRNSPLRDKILLIITHDEHGGCFDHVAPPAAVPPAAGETGLDGFKFDRLGVRVPMIMVSSHIQPGTIINETHDHASFLKTMSLKWGFGSLTERDRNAQDFSHVFSAQARSTDWPELTDPLPEGDVKSNYHDHPLSDLQKSILAGAEHLLENQQPDMLKRAGLKVRQEIETVKDAVDHLESMSKLL